VLAFVALAPWCVLARRLRGVPLFLAGTLTGAALLTFGCMWIARTDPANLVLMVVPESLFFGGFALLLRALLVARGLRAVAALPIAFTAMEFVRGRWPLDCFPWLARLLQHRFPGSRRSPISAASTSSRCSRPRRARSPISPRATRGGTAARPARRGGGLLACGYGVVRRSGELHTEPGPALLLVQPNIPQKLKDSGEHAVSTRQLHSSWSRAKAASSEPRRRRLVRDDAERGRVPETLDDPRLAERELRHFRPLEQLPARRCSPAP
jgi:apolipoprotein N-acyltransferase